jgi:D-aspartate ligase
MHNVESKPVVLITAVGAPPGLNTLRALLEYNCFDVVAADADKYSPAIYGFGVPHVVLSRVTDEAVFIGELKQVIREKNIKVIISCIETEIFAIARHAKELEAMGVHLLIPNRDVLVNAANKGRATATAFQNGIPCPVSRVIPVGGTPSEKRQALSAFLMECPLPWILKPTIGYGMRHVARVDSIDAAFQVLLNQNQEFLVQEFIPAPVGNMYIVGLLYNRAGQVMRKFSSRSIRTLFSDGGPATAGVSVYVPEIIEATIKLIAQIGQWRGPVAVEWLRDLRDDQFKFIEINPRIWGYSYLATGSGINFPAATVELCLNRDVGLDPGFKTGVTMLRINHDLIFPECPFELNV